MGLPTIAVPEYELTLPSTEKKIKYRPFLVKEEKILLIALESEDQTNILNAIKTIIDACIFGDTLKASEMPTFDLEYIFLQLRAKSKGEVIDLKYECPKCKTELEVNINTEDIQVTKKDEHTNTIELNEELGVVMKYPTIEMQHMIQDMQEKKQSEVEGLFKLVTRCIDYIYDKDNTYPLKDHTEKEVNDFIDSLTDDHFQKISKFFETMPVLQHEFQLKCTKKKKEKTCSYKETITLSGLQSFFA
jgi:hypothetical protein